MFSFLAIGFALAPVPTTVEVDVKPDRVVFRSGDAVITEYRTSGTVQVEKGTGTKPLAKPFFWPVNAPGGLAVTRPWPMKRGTPGETTDHFHQKSAWFCHGDVIAEGLKTKPTDKHVKGIDFWSEYGAHGRIVPVKVSEAGPGAIRVESEWKSPEGTVVLNEAAVITVKVLDTGRLIEYDTTLTAPAYPITFGDTKEGSFGVRVPDGMQIKTGRGVVSSSNGAVSKSPAKDDLPLWGRHAEWNDYSGEVDGHPAGIAIFVDPKNHVPSAWHTRAYGLMAANPFGRAVSKFPAVRDKTDLVKIAKGESLKLRYAIYTHTGDAKTGKIEEAFKAFSRKD